jgi:hypothetical protein
MQSNQKLIMNKNYINSLIKTGAVFPPLVPALIIGGAAIAIVAALFSDDKKAKAESEKTENQKSASQIIVVPRISKPTISATPRKIELIDPLNFSIPVEKINSKRPVTREHLTKIFQNGIRALTRNQAVEELKQLGFRKTAAYKALAENGRFSFLFDFSSDGTIRWKSGIA